MAGNASETFGRALENLQGMRNQGGLSETQQQELNSAIDALESIGECQREVPFSTLRPVGRPDGTLRWCCNHEQEHCF